MICKKIAVIFYSVSSAVVLLVFVYHRTTYCTLADRNVPTNVHTDSTMTVLNVTLDNPVPDIVNDVIIPDGEEHLLVHIIRLYEDPPNKDSHSFCWTECISLLSVLLYVKPTKIYVHTNYPDYWPFGRCYMITDYSLIQFVYRRRRFVLNKKRIAAVAHEADLVKYSVVYQYGGIAMDIDVFPLPKMTSLIEEWRKGKYSCLVNREDKIMNSGFVACRKGHPYIRDVLTHYNNDYRGSWLYNSGVVPLKVYNEKSEYKKAFYVDNQMGNHSSSYKGPIRYKDIPAWHSYFHGCKENEENTRLLAVNSTFWEMLHFIAAEGWKLWPYPTTTPKTTITTTVTRKTDSTTSMPNRSTGQTKQTNVTAGVTTETVLISASTSTTVMSSSAFTSSTTLRRSGR